MLYSHKAWLIVAALLVLLLGGCGLSLAEDVTPPPNYREPTVEEQAVEVSAAFPLIPPDPVQGEAIYLEKCLPCHGENGMGDGPQAANLANPVAPLGSPDLARSARPIDWYEMVTFGNIERFMPGFASLNDRQRWDVVAYAMTLSSTPEELAQGQIGYEQNCAACHGLLGLGDGEEVANLSLSPASWADQERLAGLSAEDMVNVMTGGIEGHPSFADQLDGSQRYAVAAYVRSLSFTSIEVPVDNAILEGDQQTSEESSVEQPETVIKAIAIYGKVVNATPGGSIPPDLEVVITAFEGMSPAFEVSGSVKEDGSYRVDDVAFNPDYVYFAQVEANGLTFNSDILHGTDIIGEDAELQVAIYETTTDLAALRADRLHVFFDFSQPGVIQVVNLFIISNPSGEVVVAPGEDEPVIRFALPDGAMNLQFQDGELGGRYIETSDGFGDRMGVAPGSGQHQILFAYNLPYDRRLTLDIPLPLPVDAAIVMVPPGGVNLKSEQLMDAGQRDVQGMAYQVYQTSSSIPAGRVLSLSLSGRVNSAGTTGQSGATQALLVGAGVFGAVLLGAGLWLYRQRADEQVAEDELEGVEEQAAVETSESILDAIVALDDLHASGNLPEPAYKERRTVLKSLLAEALEREKAD